MRTKHTITVRATRDGDDTNRLVIEVYYSKGGVNYFTGGVSPRGYYVSVTPLTNKDGMESCVLGRGRARLIAPASRRSDKQLLSWVVPVMFEMRECSDGPTWAMVDRVCEECGLEEVEERIGPRVVA